MFGTHLDRIWTVFRPFFSGFLRGSALITGIGDAVAVYQAAALALHAFACSSLWTGANSWRHLIQARWVRREARLEGVQ